MSPVLYPSPFKVAFCNAQQNLAIDIPLALVAAVPGTAFVYFILFTVVSAPAYILTF